MAANLRFQQPKKAALSLDPLLKPESIALLGASAKEDSNGLALVEMCAIDGYRGRVYPVNPKYSEINGMPCYPALDPLPERVDHVVISLANAQIEGALELSIRHGAKAVTIFGTAQTNDHSEPRLPQRIKAIAEKAGIAVCGASSMGFYSPLVKLRVAAFPSPPGLRKGGIALIAQSGAAFSALAHNDKRLGFSLCVSTGMETIVSAADYAEWALHQPETKVIGLFLEQVRDPEKFVAVLDLADRRDTPVVILKVGRTPRSAAMAVTHTGALAGNDQAFVAMCRRHNVIIVDDLDEMSATLAFLDQERRLSAGQLASIHDSGGQRELAVDIADRVQLDFAEISGSTRSDIMPLLDEGLAPENPLDAYGTSRDFTARYEKIIKSLANDDNVSSCVFFSDIRDDYWYSQGVVEAVRCAAKSTAKPLAIATNYSQTSNSKSAMTLALEGIPLLEGTRETLLAIKHATQWRDRRRSAPIVLRNFDQDIVAKWQLKLGSQKSLLEHEGLDLLADFGIATVMNRLATSVDEACDAARMIGFPVVLKTAEGHAHKSEVGGVHLALKDEAAVKAAYLDVLKRLGPKVLISAMAPSGIELGLGAVVDKSFGPMVVLSAGGTLIEYLDDVVSALAPISEQEAMTLISELKLYRILKGVRGNPSVDLSALSKIVASFSQMIAVLSHNISEIDVNPVIAGESSVYCVDALVVAG
ncbi:MAG: hypothetical protein DI537_34850 [Stutzerimonas stutzeri]|jgi:acyl-CoA synthetase (NDP forming)|nr:MAG: hypothetical protein DI537_34850 [Stutzerimonas stutzeri]